MNAAGSCPTCSTGYSCPSTQPTAICCSIPGSTGPTGTACDLVFSFPSLTFVTTFHQYYCNITLFCTFILTRVYRVRCYGDHRTNRCNRQCRCNWQYRPSGMRVIELYYSDVSTSADQPNIFSFCFYFFASMYLTLQSNRA